MDTIGSRLKHLRGSKNQAEFAQLIGVSRNTLVNYERGANDPGSKIIAKICDSLSVSAEWLLFGHGPMTRSESASDLSAPQSPATKPLPPQPKPSAPIQDSFSDCAQSPLAVPFSVQPDPGQYDWIPMVEAKLSAGGGSFENGETIRDYYAFRKRFIQRMACCAKNLVLLRVSGNSMDPEIRNGATVMIDLGRTSIKNGCIFALGMGDTILLKELEPMPGGRVRVVSKNREEFPPYEVNAHDLRIIGQAVWSDRLLPL